MPATGEALFTMGSAEHLPRGLSIRGGLIFHSLIYALIPTFRVFRVFVV